MQFTQHLREPIRNGEITKSVRVWKSARVKVGNAYRLDLGRIIVESIHEIGFDDITPQLARETGFKGVADLLKIAKHGRGETVFSSFFPLRINVIGGYQIANISPDVQLDKLLVKESVWIVLPLPPNEQLNLTLYPGLRLACAKPQSRVKRKLTRC